MTKQQAPEDERLSALYQQTPRDEPSAQMDAAIKKLAHGAVRKPWITLPRMAMAASVLLMAGVGVNVYYQPETEMDYAPAMESFMQEPSPAQSLIQEKTKPQALLSDGVQQRAYAPAIPLAADMAESKAAPRKRLIQKVQQDCQVPEALINQDAQAWQSYIQTLRKAKQHAEADCLQKLLEQR